MYVYICIYMNGKTVTHCVPTTLLKNKVLLLILKSFFKIIVLPIPSFSSTPQVDSVLKFVLITLFNFFKVLTHIFLAPKYIFHTFLVFDLYIFFCCLYFLPHFMYLRFSHIITCYCNVLIIIIIV